MAHVKETLAVSSSHTQGVCDGMFSFYTALTFPSFHKADTFMLSAGNRASLTNALSPRTIDVWFLIVSELHSN